MKFSKSLGGYKSLCFLFVLILLCWLPACGGEDDSVIDGDTDLEQGDVVTEPTKFLLGYSEIDITPYPEFETVLMGSYGVPSVHRAMVGVHDPLMAQVALIKNDANQAFMLVSLDLCGYSFEFADNGPGVREVRESISEALSDILTIAPEQIVLASSHNHTSTDLVGMHQDIGGTISRDLLEWHVEKITTAAVEAAQSFTEVDLFFSETELVGYAGRDEVPVGSGQRCSEVIDDRIYTMRAKDKDGQVMLTVTNYAKHPTQIDWLLKEATADYIWAYRLEIEEKTGGEAMFIQSFEAAVHDGDAYADIPGEEGSYEKTENFGRLFANAVIDGTENEVKAEEFDIEHKEEVFPLKGHGFYRDLAKYARLDLRSFDVAEDTCYILKYVPASWHKLGPAQFVVWPGEIAPEYGVAIRERMQTPVKFLVGLGNDQVGYIVDAESVANDPTGKLAKYEANTGPGIGAGEVIMEVMESFDFMTAKE